jgi:glycosyltransferase involved in cell wall biosynthesis
VKAYSLSAFGYSSHVASEVLIVIPTLGQRVDYLRQTLESIRKQSISADIVMVTPISALAARAMASEFTAKVLDDPGSLPAAINLGVSQALPHHRYVNWLGDDDLLTAQSLQDCVTALTTEPNSVLAYGACRYIDDTGAELWVSKAGKWADRILAWGPDLIPQPGMLIRKSGWNSVGGVDETLSHAFDLDLLLKLRGLGDFTAVDSIVSCFRWHPDSLTVSDRSKSLNESEAIKRRYLSARQSKFKWIWEQPVRAATRVAAQRLNKRAYRLSAAKTCG